MNDVETVSIICLMLTIIICSFIFTVWDYNKGIDEVKVGYKRCLEDCASVHSTGETGTPLDEANCVKDCYAFFYDKDANCTKDEVKR